MKCLTARTSSNDYFAARHESLYQNALRGPTDHAADHFYHTSHHAPYSKVTLLNMVPVNPVHRQRKRAENASDIFHRSQLIEQSPLQLKVQKQAPLASLKVQSSQDQNPIVMPAPITIDQPTRAMTVVAKAAPTPTLEQSCTQTIGLKMPVRKSATIRPKTVSFREAPPVKVLEQRLHAQIFDLQIRKGWKQLTAQLIARLLKPGERLLGLNPMRRSTPICTEGELRIETTRGLVQLKRKLKQRGIIAQQKLRY